MFTFPLLSPGLATQFNLSQPQLTTIVLACVDPFFHYSYWLECKCDDESIYGCRNGWIGCWQAWSFYLLSHCCLSFLLWIWWFCIWSLQRFSQSSWSLSNIFLSFGFLFRAGWPWHCVFVSFGTWYAYGLPFKSSIFRYFSSLFAASKSFPNHIGLASGASMALFSLSPLFLSAIASNFFIHPATGQLSICHFMSFLSLLTGFVYILGFINMQGLKHSIDRPQTTSELVEENIPQETSPLLAPTSQSRFTTQASNPSAMELLRRIDFWLLVIFCVFIIGAVSIFPSMQS